ncbi:hypothetical protein AA0120_g4113 [Alternaria tenuissima]|nr:hypothetical protein AA0120_g4113 [Alternaria tenuissima]
MNDERCPWPFDPILIDIEPVTQNDRQQTADTETMSRSSAYKSRKY